MASSATAVMSPGLSSAGIALFGGLCAGTFGLGTWQVARFFEKTDMVEERERQMALPPTPLEGYAVCYEDELVGGQGQNRGYYPPPSRHSNGTGSNATKTTTTTSDGGLRKVEVRGAFRHRDEALVGPRGPPPGSLATTGPQSGRTQGGLSTGPQGYYVVTPLERVDGKGTLLVNRGWIPKSYHDSSKQSCLGQWSRPLGIVDVVGVTTKTEKPRYFSPPARTAKDPRVLLWMDRPVLESITRTEGLHPILVTETDNIKDNKIHRRQFPATPSLDTVGEFSVTPSTHFGYAVTWYALSVAGVVMTRRLMLRGKG